MKTNMEGLRASSFLRLPGELRNILYRMALVFENQIEMNVQSCEFSGVPLQFVHVCQQIRKEAYSILLEENRFQYTLLHWHERSKKSFLKTIGPRKARRILDIAIRLPNGLAHMFIPAQPLVLNVRHIMKLMVYNGTQIHDDACQLFFCGIPITSIKLFSSFLTRCPVEILEHAQVSIDQMSGRLIPKARGRYRCKPQLE